MTLGDVRYALRSLARTPAFTLTAALVLALGIGANTAIFSVVHGVLLRPLPFEDPDRLIRIWSSREDRDLPFFSVSIPDFVAWRERARTLEVVAAYDRQRAVALRDGRAVEQIQATRVTAATFALLGVRPAQGRWLTADEEGAGAAGGPAVISHGLWQRRYGGRADILGQPLVVDDQPRTIVGVMPAAFGIPNAPSDIWVPLDVTVDPTERSRFLRVLARVGKGFDVDAARRELSAIAVALGDEYPDSNRSWSVTVRPLIETVVSPEFRRSVLLLTGAVAFVLLIACANVTSLLLSRATVRRREMAIRAALGANRAQLVRLLLVESVVLAAAAGALGVMLAVWGVEVLKRLDPGSIPRLDEVTLSAPVLVVAGFASLLTALVFGIVPALTSASGTGTELRTRESSPDRRTSRSRDLLVLGEVALAVVLLIGAGLMMRSFVRLQQRALGFDAGSLMTAQLATPPERPSQASDTTAATERILARLAELPGVSNVAGGSRLPFAGPNSGNVFEIEGVVHPSDERPDTDYRVVTADYFRTLAIPLIRGRVFTPGDGPAAPAVVISASTARRYWANRDPLGARVRLGDSPWMTVVGVVGDARYFAIDAPGDSVRPMMYVPHAQMPDVWLMFAIRTRTAPDALAETLRSTLSAAVPEAPVVSIEPMSAILAQALGPQRFGTTLFAVFAWVAVFLAAAGVYGLIAYFVSCRTREIGVRVALGASTTDIVRMTAGRGIVLSAGGLVTGLAVARALSGLLSRVLFEVSPVDPATYAVVAIGFLALAAAASYVPARRALQIDPARTLNAE